MGKVNRVKKIRRRGKDGSKINRQQHFVRKKVKVNRVKENRRREKDVLKITDNNIM